MVGIYGYFGAPFEGTGEQVGLLAKSRHKIHLKADIFLVK